jgi:voltage-gated potassium channel Kch
MSESDRGRSAADGDASGVGGGDGGRGRDVVVPMRLYKTVTVFSTLLAVVAVVLGFVFLDAATASGGILRALAGLVLVGGLGADVGAVSAAFETLRPAFAVVGLGGIGLGAGVYVVGSRFRAEGMGNAQDDTDEEATDG